MVAWHLGFFVESYLYHHCHKEFVKEDVYVVGFTCKLFSQEAAGKVTRGWTVSCPA